MLESVGEERIVLESVGEERCRRTNKFFSERTYVLAKHSVQYILNYLTM